MNLSNGLKDFPSVRNRMGFMVSLLRRMAKFGLLALLAAVCGLAALMPGSAHGAGSVWQCFRSAGSDFGFGKGESSVFESADFVGLSGGITTSGRLSGGEYGVDHDKADKWPYPAYFGTLQDLVDILWYDAYSSYSNDHDSVGFGLENSGDSAAFGVWTYLTRGLGVDPGQGDPDNHNTGHTSYGMEPSKVFGGVAEYYNRRRFEFSNSDRRRVSEFQARWVDRDNPGGGLDADYADILEQERASGFDEIAATETVAQGGTRTHIGTHQVPASTYQLTFECTDAPSCSGTSTSATSTVTTSSTIVEQNNGEVLDQRVADSTRPVGDGHETVDVSDIPASAIDDYRDPAGRPGFTRTGVSDGSGDELQVTINLKPNDRLDYRAPRGDGHVLLRAFGTNPWSYDGYGLYKVRLPNTFEKAGDTAKNLNQLPDSVTGVHNGYRQPFLTDQDGFIGEPANIFGHLNHAVDGWGNEQRQAIKWPTGFEDLHWYLFALPGTPGSAENRAGDDVWRYWLSDAGAKLLVESGYAENGEAVFDPTAADVACAADGDILKRDIECEDGDGADPDGREALIYPFDAFASSEAKLAGSTGQGLTLIRKGVERPADADNVGVRSLSEFFFTIKETSTGLDLPSAAGGDVAKRLGIPLDLDRRNSYIDDWESNLQQNLNPNNVHLLVVAYYEMEGLNKADRVKYGLYSAEGDVETIQVPERKMRRVLCRMMVFPAGFEPAADDSRRWYEKIGATFTKGFKSLIDPFTSWIRSWVTGLFSAPQQLVQKAGEVVCTGAEITEEAQTGESRSGGDIYHSEEDSDLIRVNRSERSRTQGIEDCQQVKDPPVTTCGAGAVPVGRRCVELPKMRMFVQDARFLSDLRDRSYVSYRRLGGQGVNVRTRSPGGLRLQSERRQFQPLLNKGAVEGNTPDGQFYHENSGLTEVEIGWETLGNFNREYGLTGLVDGYAIRVAPDSVVNSLLGEEVRQFYLPLRFLGNKVVDGRSGTSYGDEVQVFDRFRVGGLSESFHYAAGANAIDFTRPADTGNFTAKDPGAIGNVRQVADYKGFNNLLSNMPLAPGFTHSFSIAQYTGNPGETDFIVGPYSDWLTIYGRKAACLVNTQDGGAVVSGNNDRNEEPRGPLREWGSVAEIQSYVYGCSVAANAVAPPTAPEDVVFGLLPLAVGERCKDIFTSTPMAYTWGNAVVRDAWGFMWILAGMVLFTLLIWHGLKMTYDSWVEPRPDFGLREALPRFGLAVVLAAGSLFLCELILGLVSDLTCYVSERTSVTIWSFITDIFWRFFKSVGALVYSVWSGGLGDKAALGGVAGAVVGVGVASVVGLLGKFFIIALILGIVVTVFAFLLVLFVKLWFIMLMRVAMLAVLIVFAPLAFAFYASPATAHWTKRWISMFLGTALQQAVILIVVYIGSYIMLGYVESGVDTNLGAFITLAAMTGLILALAVKVPDIVNPSGKGLFSAFGEIAKMAVAAGVLVGTAGAGAVAGGVGTWGARAAGSAGGAASGGGVQGGLGQVGQLKAAGDGAASGTAGTSSVGTSAPSSGGAPSAAAEPTRAARWRDRFQQYSGYKPTEYNDAGDVTREATIPSYRQGIMHGMSLGGRQAQRLNTRIANVLGGHSLYAGRSTGDDTAELMRERMRMERARQPQSSQRRTPQRVNRETL